MTLKSIKAQHPQSRCLLLLLDGKQTDDPGAGIELMEADAIIDWSVLAAMRKRYSQSELCFALKPFLLRAALNMGASQAHYFDGDCLAYAPLDPMLEQLDGADLLLTPHSLTPIPDDGLRPGALTLLRAGSFNAGYIGVRGNIAGREALNWLARMTQDRAFNRPREGMCGDQRWLDLAPVLFPGLAICRHPGANVAYWNLHERALSVDDRGRPCAAGQPLLFFHFSGYDPAQPASLSIHQSRHVVSPDSVLAELLADYRARVPYSPKARSAWRFWPGRAR